jgi:outer membrane protein OmpA-like peptidoglycan-associated protein/tetratricopeptide (TPR) repeat protein
MLKRQFNIVLLLLFVLPGVLTAQNIKSLIEKGDRLLNRNDYDNALTTFLEAYNLAPEDPDINYRVGVSYLHGEKKSRAVPFLEKAFALKPQVDLDIDYHLGLAYQNDHQYAKAIQHFEEYKRKNKRLSEIADHKIKECTIGDSLSRHPAYVEIENIGGVINTNFHDYSPLISEDGETMIFTSNRTEDMVMRSGLNYEDIYITRKTPSGWSTPQKISPEINIKYNDAAASLSPDGKILFLYYEEGNGDIYTSTFTDGQWTKPIPLNKNINHPNYWETSACISSDGKKLYFTSNRPGGQGELDIYVSERDKNGEWGKAVNLGPTVNTLLNEDSPFIHHDGKTLFFSSDGHPSMGSNDIFKTELVDGKWTKPENMGYPINSVEYDGFFTLSPDKKTGYFSALRDDGKGSADIYKITFLEPPPKPVITASVEPEPIIAPPVEEPKVEDYVDPIIQFHTDMEIVTVLKGKVIDELSTAPLGAVITLVDNETGKVITKITSDALTGDFKIVIPHGGNYGVSTERKGYLFNSMNFNLPQFAEYQEIDTHILMVKAEVGSKVILKNIFFDVGQSDIKNESMVELERIRDLLATNSFLKVQINGHTDNSGNDATNMALSLRRAEAVVNYLMSKGIETTRLSAKGFGSQRPLVSNDDETEGRAINRRTEIEIIEASGGH